MGAGILNLSLANAKNPALGNSLAVQWLGLATFTALGPGLMPGQGTKTPQVAPPKKILI